MALMSLESIISAQTNHARRKILGLLNNGDILVNGSVATDLMMTINTKTDEVIVLGKAIDCQVTFYYFKFHKPKGVITSLDDPRGRITITKYMKELPHSLFPVGRLDRQTSGLLLLTNDGAFSHCLSHPSFMVPKKYYVELNKPLETGDVHRLSAGFFLEDGPARFDSISRQSNSKWIVTISIGRNRIVRRMFDFLGYQVKDLVRLSVGSIHLDELPCGMLKPLKKSEVREVFKESKT